MVDSHPSPLSETQMDDATCANNTPEQITSITTNMVEEDSHPSPLSETQMDDATCANNTPEQITSITTNMVEEVSHPPPLSETQMDDATCANNTPEQMTSITTNMVEEVSHPPPLSETQMDDATCANNTPEQMTGITTNMVEEDSHPSPLSETQMDDATCANNTPEQIEDTDLEDSDELYDSTPESADDYIPERLLDSDEEDRSIQDGNCPSGDETSAEETFYPSERNEMPSRPSKRCEPPPPDDEISSGVSAVKPSSKDSSAEETFHHTDRNEMPPQPSKRREPPQPSKRREPPRPSKRREPPSSEDEISSGVSAVKPSSKGKGPLKKKKTPWQQTEVQAVERHMNRFITSCVVPGKSDCERCLNAEPEALKNRDWQNLKFYVYNRITAYKRKFQCE
ncbi:hypothetical protein GBF38_010212 [Nibea albiflora]|uniref:Uncharacterized protein n=1 Tax=Nibea albiflora TaxID=240163 RepID=A0ACB7F8V5_NIBAL|nr:hypothetical protein GBF38_010212 [Nibea albiflora]